VQIPCLDREIACAYKKEFPALVVQGIAFKLLNLLRDRRSKTVQQGETSKDCLLISLPKGNLGYGLPSPQRIRHDPGK
jgi:hypothetical protein